MTAHPQRRPTRTDGWSDPAFAQVAEIVYLVAGLTFPPNRQPSAESGLRRAMSALRIATPLALARGMETPGEVRDTVLAELTIGETYFFREAGQLELLRSRVLPGLAADATLRVWSAGCASGEEPYTVAILLRELGWTRPARILGTDIALPRLDAARRARYTRWSLRGVSPERVDRWFTRRAAHFQLDAAIRDAVEFAPLNLVSGDYPDASTGQQHLVLCRNVLIYFDMPTVARIAARLLDALDPDGWLVCGASDPPLAGLVPCEVEMTPAGMAYRRADRLPGATDAPTRSGVAGSPPASEHAGAWYVPHAVGEARAPASLTPSVAPALVLHAPLMPRDERLPVAAPAGPAAEDSPDAVAYARADYPRAETLARASLALDASDAPRWIRLVRAIANQGRLRDADAECVRALDTHRMVVELHYLHAMLLGTAGQHAEAVKASRRALFLDRHFVMAHLQIGASLAQDGDAEGAARAFDNALVELAGMDDASIVPGADGVPASRLRAGATARRAALAAGGRP